MSERFGRTELIFGSDAMEKLAAARVAVFGVGGVGGFVVETLARAGVGALDLIDNDQVCLSNFNRQIIALQSTLGKYKVDAAAERIADINPDAAVRTYKIFYAPDTAEQFDFSEYDYIVDAIDSVSGKIELVLNAKACKTPIICSMGAGNLFDPTAFEVTDIYKTSVCPLARVMRCELKKRGVDSLKVVYSKEKPHKPFNAAPEADNSGNNGTRRKRVPGSTSFVPPVVGMIIAGEVIKDIIGI
ncbi:MAG: tRNA threonylcarbamoyladenosine dehydratase [Oscillospiraceae bacterium]|nr:tRNA threonylcarbamoyladenosine dehydratase [Oscillospiraceae bacterium]